MNFIILYFQILNVLKLFKLVKRVEENEKQKLIPNPASSQNLSWKWRTDCICIVQLRNVIKLGYPALPLAPAFKPTQPHSDPLSLAQRGEGR